MNPPDEEWQDRVKGILKSELARRHISYRDLADKLANPVRIRMPAHWIPTLAAIAATLCPLPPKGESNSRLGTTLRRSLRYSPETSARSAASAERRSASALSAELTARSNNGTGSKTKETLPLMSSSARCSGE